MIVCMCDGSSKGNPGPLAFGIVIWDRSKDSRITRPTFRFNKWEGYGTNNEAEWIAIIKAMTFLADKGYRDQVMYFYSDSQLVINQITGKWGIKHANCQNLYNDYRAVLGSLMLIQNELNFCWVPRQLIQLADKEAQKGNPDDMSVLQSS